MYGKVTGAAAQYGQVAVQSDVSFADPHRLIQLLLEGALDKISAAKGHMARGEIAQKSSHISWAIAILGGLRLSLDKAQGGEIAENLDSLYDYMGRRLLTANLENNPTILDEIQSLLHEIKSAWDAIPETFRKGGADRSIAGGTGVP